MKNLIKIDALSYKPKYKQIVDCILEGIEKNTLEKDQRLPSINEICSQYGLARDTVVTAFTELKTRGIIISRPGKGNYISKSSINQQHNIFVLFDKITAYKELLYETFKEQFNRKATIDIFFHHFNERVFNTLISQAAGNYTSYVIMPIPSRSLQSTLDLIPQDKLYILDRGRKIFGQKYPSVCQNFKDDIYNGLLSAGDLTSKYSKLNMVFPESSNVPNELRKGFTRFCKEHGLASEIYNGMKEIEIKTGEAYLALDDRHLVKLVQYVNDNNLTLGKDLGIISYNDTPLKSVVANGITTISTDFAEMGKNMADLIINKKREFIQNPSRLIRRNSL